MTGAALLWGIVFGSIGFAYLMYGRKQKAPVPLVCGVLLIGFTWFTDNTYAMVAIGAILMAAPLFVRL